MNLQTIIDGKVKSKLALLLIAVLSVVLLPLCFYLYKFFNGFSFSDNLSDWANFSTFYFGYLAMIGSILNSIAFVWLTLYIHTSENKRQEREINLQQVIVKTDLRKNIIDSFRQNLDAICTKKFTNIDLLELSSLEIFLNDFIESSSFLFRIDQNQFDSLFASIKKLIAHKQNSTSPIKELTFFLNVKTSIYKDLYDQLINGLKGEY